MTEDLQSRCRELGKVEILRESGESKSQMYQWERGVSERKGRREKEMDEQTVTNAVEVVMRYPTVGGIKGRSLMVYHRLGAPTVYQYLKIKRIVKVLVKQEVNRRKLIPAGHSYEHEKPATIGEIWAEDFTELVVENRKVKVGLLIDVFSQYILGFHVAAQARETLVSLPVKMALEENGGVGPQRFLISDNGKQYISEQHEQLLTAKGIVHRLIPACRPEYNGSVECGIKEWKKAFYPMWEKLVEGRDLSTLDESGEFATRESGETAAREAEFWELLHLAVRETVDQINTIIPRVSLGGVTPRDVHRNRQDGKREENADYIVREKEREKKPIKGDLWSTIRAVTDLKNVSGREILTMGTSFTRKPLRNLANFHRVGMNHGGVG